MENILQVNGLVKNFGGFTALQGVDLHIAPGERLGLIGPNGSGKTTLISCIAGALQNDSGTIRFNGDLIGHMPAYVRTRKGIARSFQIPRPFTSMTVVENLMVPLAYVGGMTGTKAKDQAMQILADMGLASKAESAIKHLSQVELRKMELARAMAAKPKLLISDEAMAGLAGAEVDEVLQILFDLNKTGITIIMIEHIMQAVMKFSQRVVCLDAGKIICEGTPEDIVKNPEVQRAYLGD
ncbi:MAG: ABC transporter ATP-binding protein [Burkholderiales bacterium]|nr:ABC transporter ATP-binding protein [Burkholderiales bacterium]